MDTVPAHFQSANYAEHSHRHDRAEKSSKRLVLVVTLTGLYMFAELFGGLWTGSLALLADSGHMLADVAALLLAVVAVWFWGGPATTNQTFGYDGFVIPVA